MFLTGSMCGFAQDGKVSDQMELHPSAIVSNHVSYIDILYHMSASFPSFVAKVYTWKLVLDTMILEAF